MLGCAPALMPRSKAHERAIYRPQAEFLGRCQTGLLAVSQWLRENWIVHLGTWGLWLITHIYNTAIYELYIMYQRVYSHIVHI